MTKWQWQTYDAWCRHNGAHSTRNRAYTDWNTKIVWKLRAELDFQWDIVEEEVGAVFNELRAAVAEQFDALKKAVRDLSSSAPGELHAQVLAGIEARIEGCEYGVTRAQERFDRDVKSVPPHLGGISHQSTQPGSLTLQITDYSAATYPRHATAPTSSTPWFPHTEPPACSMVSAALD